MHLFYIQKMNQTQKTTLALSLLVGALASTLLLIGFITAVLFDANKVLGIESPLSLVSNDAVAPSDVIQKNDIKVYPDRVVIYVENASLSTYASTGSMKPLFDESANGLRIQPTSASEIKVGDIITFKRGNDLVVHRVIETGTDESGIYFITKGDNNTYDDGKVYFDQVLYKTVALFY